MRTLIVDCGACRVRVRSWGPPAAPHAVLIPGMGADARSLAPQVRLLRRLGYATHVLELPGFGVAPPLRGEDARLARLADHVIAATSAVGIGRAVFVGHSLGGGIALAVALARPGLVERLVLLAPAAVGTSLLWTFRLLALPLVGDALLRPGPSGARRFLRAYVVGRRRRDDARFVDALLRQERRTPVALRSIRAIVRANQPPGAAKLRALFLPGGEQLGFTLAPRLAELAHVPTLVLWGGDDRVISPRDARFVRTANPYAEVHVVDGVGHALPLEAPGWVNAHVAAFLGARASPRVAA